MAMINKEKYLSIKQAVELTGKSESTIRNFIKSLSESDTKNCIERKGLKIFILRSVIEDQFLTKKITAFDLVLQNRIEFLEEQLRIKDNRIAELLESRKQQNLNLGATLAFLDRVGIDLEKINLK